MYPVFGSCHVIVAWSALHIPCGLAGHLCDCCLECTSQSVAWSATSVTAAWSALHTLVAWSATSVIAAWSALHTLVAWSATQL